MNKKNLLTVLLILLGLSAVYSYLYSPRQERVSKQDSRVKANSSATGKVNSKDDQDRVHLELLTPTDEPFQAARKDIFGPLVYYVPPPKPPTPPRVVAPPPPPAPVAVAPKAETFAKPLPRFTLLGSIEKDGVKQVFLSLGSDVFVVKTGSRFGKSSEFTVTGMTDNMLTISMAGEERAINIPLRDRNEGKPIGIKRKASPPSRPEPPQVLNEPVEQTATDNTQPQEQPAPEPDKSGTVPYLKMPE